MRSKFKWIFTLLLAFTMQFSFAQEKTVTGVISDKTGPLPGANVVVKGTTRSAQADFDGKYTIKAKVGETLVFSFTGYNNSSVTVGAAANYNVVLSDGIKLDEVVLDGYRATKKSRSGIAQSTVNAKALQDRPNATFVQSLQAQVPGLYIASSSGTPGSNRVTSLIRGLSSLNGNTEPLYVIDGIAANQQIFRGINPNDIESATVLKDAAATAIYGNRGSGGVIVIKTKNGKYDSKLVVKYSGSTGYTTLQDNRYHITNTRELLTLERAKGVGKGGTEGSGPNGAFTDAEIAAYPINTDWKKIFFRTGVTKSHDISFSGGTAKTTNFTSFGYYEQQGIVKNTDFKRFSVRSNFTGKSSSDKFTYGTTIYASFSKRGQLAQETNALQANVAQNPLQGILSSLPYLDPNVYVSGQQLFDQFGAPSFAITPYMLMDYLNPGNIPRIYDETKLIFNANASYSLTKNLTYSAVAGSDYAQELRNSARAPWSYLALAAKPAGAEFGGNETQTINRDFTFDFTNKLNYKATYKEKHSFEANAFFQYIKMHNRNYAYVQNGLDPRTWSLGAGTGYIPFNPNTPTLYLPTVVAGNVNAGLLSYFGTADYDYDGRFGLATTLRRDASYRFSSLNRWGTFYSVAGHWNIDKEKFMAKSDFFDELKLRVSYGTTGNQNIGGGGSGTNANFLLPNLIRDVNNTSTAYGGAAGIDLQSLTNRAIKWETAEQTNIGIDFGIKNRLSGSIDVYRKRIYDLFDAYILSAVTSQYNLNANVGSIQSKGVELSLKYDVLKKSDLKLDVFFNGAFNKSTYLTTLNANNADQWDGGGSIRYVNGLVGEYYLAPYVGVNPADGNLLFLDINNNLTETITDADRRKTSKSALPVYQGGFGFNASYKGFFVNTQFSFAKDVWRFDFDLTNLSDPTQLGTFPVTNDLLHAWTPTNTNTNVPSLTADPANLSNADNFSDRWLRDASYIRLKVFTLGYNFPAKSLEKTGIGSLRIYSLFENYMTWTKWRGLDAENAGSSNQGGYPAPKTISFGLDIQI